MVWVINVSFYAEMLDVRWLEPCLGGKVGWWVVSQIRRRALKLKYTKNIKITNDKTYQVPIL